MASVCSTLQLHFNTFTATIFTVDFFLNCLNVSISCAPAVGGMPAAAVARQTDGRADNEIARFNRKTNSLNVRDESPSINQRTMASQQKFTTEPALFLFFPLFAHIYHPPPPRADLQPALCYLAVPGAEGRPRNGRAVDFWSKS